MEGDVDCDDGKVRRRVADIRRLSEYIHKTPSKDETLISEKSALTADYVVIILVMEIGSGQIQVTRSHGEQSGHGGHGKLKKISQNAGFHGTWSNDDSKVA